MLAIDHPDEDRVVSIWRCSGVSISTGLILIFSIGWIFVDWGSSSIDTSIIEVEAARIEYYAIAIAGAVSRNFWDLRIDVSGLLAIICRSFSLSLDITNPP